MQVHAEKTPAPVSAAVKQDVIAAPVLDVAIDYRLAELSQYYRVIRAGKTYTDAVAWCIFFVCLLLWQAVKAFYANDLGTGLLFLLLTSPLLYYVLQPLIVPRAWFKGYRHYTSRLVIGENGVRVIEANKETFYNWVYFLIGWEDAQMLCICDTNGVIFIPRRVFTGNAQHEAEVRALLVRHLPLWMDARTAPSGHVSNQLHLAKKQAEQKRETAFNDR